MAQGKQIDLNGTIEYEYRKYLTEDEKHQLGLESVKLHNKIDKLSNEMKIKTKVMKTEIDEVKAEEKEIREALNVGFKDLTARVIVREDFENEMVYYTDPETGEEVDKREMTKKEVKAGMSIHTMQAG